MLPSHHGPPSGTRDGRRTRWLESSDGPIEQPLRGLTEHPLRGPTEQLPGEANVDEATRYETGTTIVGLRARDGVVLAADQRMSLGGAFATSKDVRKVEQVHPTAAMAIAGTVGPAQALLQELRAETGLYAARRGQPMSGDALARTAGHLARGRPVMPLLGGVDETGGHVFELDGSGSVVEDAYAAGGSGMQLAYGVLEGRFEPDASIDDAIGAAVAAVEAAAERDGATGDGVTIATVTDEGVDIEQRGAS